MNSENFNRDFKGIWIPREIWLHPNLKILEKTLWAEIHSLYNRERGGCFASNEYLSKFFGVSERYIREMLANLKNCGLLEEVSFDGRTRIIRALNPKDECQAERNCGSGLQGTAVPAKEEPQFQPTYIYNKEDNKEEREVGLSPPPHPPAPQLSSKKLNKKEKRVLKEESKKNYADFVRFTEKEYQNLLDLHGHEKLQWMIDKLNSHKVSSGQVYVSDYGTMIKGGWVLQAFEEKKAKSLPSQLNEDKFKIIQQRRDQAQEFYQKFNIKIHDKGIRYIVLEKALQINNDIIDFRENKFGELVKHSLNKYGWNSQFQQNAQLAKI